MNIPLSLLMSFSLILRTKDMAMQTLFLFQGLIIFKAFLMCV